MLRIFLSSTFQDLVKERNAVQSVIHRLSAHFIGMEYFGSFPELPSQRCLNLVRQSDLMILVLGTRYGFSPDGTNSMTELEYKEADNHRIPILAYFAGYPTYDERGEESEKCRLFHDGIKSKFGVTWFSSPEDLAWKVACDIAREFGSHVEQQGITFDLAKDEILVDPIRNDIDNLVRTLDARAKTLLLHYSSLIRQSQQTDAGMLVIQFYELHNKHIEASKTRSYYRSS